MSRNTVARASPSRNVRIRPACSTTYQRPSAACSAPVMSVNERPPNARTSWTAGIAGLTVGAGVGAGVAGTGDGAAVGDADGDTDPDGEDDGAAVGDDALAELADAAGEAPPVVATESDEHADANASASTMATRPCRIVFTLAMREDAAG